MKYWRERMAVRLVMAVCAGLFLLSACQSETGEMKAAAADAIVVKDIRGKEVRLSEPAQRVIVLYQGALDGMYMLNAEHTVVGIQNNIYTNPETFKYFSKLDPRIARKELPAPGNWETSTNIESVLALKPDLVIIASGQTDAIRLLESLGIQVYAVSPQNNEQLFEEIESIGKLTGTHERALELLAYTRHKLDEIAESTDHIEQKKSVYYAWSGGRIYSTSGQNSRMSECFELAGVNNACTFEVDQPNINPETLIAWDPDLILLWSTDPKVLYDKKELAVLTAVKNKNVHVLEPPFFYDPHTLKIMYAAIELHNVAYGANEHFDLDENRRDIMTNLYGAKATALLE
ncbi:ABC transporter substrate-binding protein [uncultured Pontibacter sp.]|uniref:ABC transporter substrate-binding protein n=1 Tax=uncultured Pontibacter sp. TaxID=453356 RepID=UPI0026049609|nr:ABC transporter substrate-binding protein [uncultured Pontibacter sp.]